MPLPNQVTTTYASFTSASREVASKGGAWYTDDHSQGTVLPHQSLGGMTDLIQLTGLMFASIIITSEVAQIGDTVKTYVMYYLSMLSLFLLRSFNIYSSFICVRRSFSFNACEVRTNGDTRTQAWLSGIKIAYCPTSKCSSVAQSLVLSQPFDPLPVSFYRSDLQPTSCRSPTEILTKSTPAQIYHLVSLIWILKIEVSTLTIHSVRYIIFKLIRGSQRESDDSECIKRSFRAKSDKRYSLYWQLSVFDNIDRLRSTFES
jgi:hypothetical protein